MNRLIHHHPFVQCSWFSYMCVWEKKKIKKQKGICIFVWMMSVYSESMEEKNSDAMVYLNLTTNERSNTVYIFHLSYFFNLTLLYKCQNYIYIAYETWERIDINHMCTQINIIDKKNFIISCSNSSLIV